ncbi:MAG: hypothetical protein COS68_04460 [Elusimicrobia bacterium CG06_land_8_20_14_3_00_38_11]|nr:MAG: hypothetical protein COS68_04460 [Elusimicrobia bacterium CG06_land_8_20_14_3_00_38_11]
MGLKIEQRLLNNEFTEDEPKIFSTGVYLVPMKIKVEGKEKFIWVAEEFEDDTSLNEKNISVRVISNNIEELFNK